MNDAEQPVDSRCRMLRAQVSEAVWLSTFQDVRPRSTVDGDARVWRCPARHVRERIEGALPPARARRAGRDRRGRRRPRRRGASPASRRASSDARSTPLPTDVGPRATASGAPATPTSDAAPTACNPRYTFEAFVTGASNRFAHAAALSVAETPARSYNPLFIYGDAGLGKTHLLQAIAHYVQRELPALHGALRLHRDLPERVRRRHPHQHRRPSSSGATARSTCCCIDDIQFIEGKEGLQEEFFHTFNALHGANSQIVHLLGPPARRHPHARGPAAQPVQDGA